MTYFKQLSTSITVSGLLCLAVPQSDGYVVLHE